MSEELKQEPEQQRDEPKEIIRRSGETTFRNVDEGVFEFSFSSEYAVQRSFGREVLSHEPGAMDTTRLNGQAPLLFNHDMDRVIGVVERGYVDSDKKKASLGSVFRAIALRKRCLMMLRMESFPLCLLVIKSTIWKSEAMILSPLHGLPMR